MKRPTYIFPLIMLVGALLVSSCSTLIPGRSAHQKFKAQDIYPKTSQIFKDEALLSAGNSSNTSINIDLSDQRAQLLVNGQVALDTPCCTGRAGKRTPTGTFRITEKISDKRSNIFGRLYRGSKQVYGGDRRKYDGKYDRFVGSSLPYWMRLTSGGIGMHYSGSVKRYAASAGCIRMPMDPVKTIYYKVKRGTKVTIQH